MWQNTKYGAVAFTGVTPNYVLLNKPPKNSESEELNSSQIQEEVNTPQCRQFQENEKIFSLQNDEFVQILSECDNNSYNCKLLSSSQQITLQQDQLTDKIQILVLFDCQHQEICQIQVDVKSKINQTLLAVAEILGFDGYVLHAGQTIPREQKFFERHITSLDKFIFVVTQYLDEGEKTFDSRFDWRSYREFDRTTQVQQFPEEFFQFLPPLQDLETVQTHRCQLSKREFDRSGYYCDKIKGAEVCKNNFHSGSGRSGHDSHTWQCRNCNFDLCEKCMQIDKYIMLLQERN